MIKSSILLLTTLLSLSSAPTFAGATGPAAVELPQGLVVRDDGRGDREVYAAWTAESVSDDASASQAVAGDVTQENLISGVQPSDELDRTSSNEAWYYYYGGYYGYYYNSYVYAYYPSYAYSNAGYNYYFYYYYGPYYHFVP